jgi:glycosyltransferase involved in cell wall biosynthesis
MRILLLVPMVPQAEGAGAIPELLHAQLTGLLDRHEVTLLGTFGDLAGQAEAAGELRRQGLDAHFVDRRRSPSLARRWEVRGRLASGWAFSRRPWRAVSTAGGHQPALDQVAESRRFDVVAVEETTLSTLRLPAGAPSVLTEHEAFKAPADGLRRIDRRRWDRFQRRAWERYDLVQVYSEGDAAAIRERSPRLAPRLRVNPFGLVMPAPADPASEVAGTLLFVGTFTHPPNREAARWLGREIMPVILARHPEARLRIVGKAPPSEVRALAGPAVEVIADAPSVRPHMEAASVVLAPVHSGGGMRMKVLQALAAGRPVVTTGRGAEGFDVLDPAPPLVIGEDVEEIAAATAALLADPTRRRELGRRSREFAERWHTPNAWAARLEAVYEEARGAPAATTRR